MAPLIIEHPENDAFSVSRFSLPLRSQLTDGQCYPSRTQKVKFGGESVINQDPEYYDDTDVETRWWTAAELNRVRKKAKDISEQLRAQSSANISSCYLTLAHRKTTLMLSSDFKALMKLPRSTPDQDLHQWCSWDDGRRGLERFASQAYWSFRRQDISNFRGVVVEEFLRQREARAYDDEMIAKIAREASRRSRTFALFLGEADALEASVIFSEPSSRRAPPVRRAPPRKKSRIEDPVASPVA